MYAGFSGYASRLWTGHFKTTLANCITEKWQKKIWKNQMVSLFIPFIHLSKTKSGSEHRLHITLSPCLLSASLCTGQIAAGPIALLLSHPFSLLASLLSINYSSTVTEISQLCWAKKSKFSGFLSGENFLMSWLCNNWSHIKYGGGGHNSRIRDIVWKRSQYYWACSSCQNITSEMRTFMMQTRSGFQKVRSQLSVLTKIYGSAESTFLGLTLLSESPRRKFLNNQLNVDFIADNAPPSEPSTPLNTSTPLAIFLNHYYLTPQTKMTQIQLLKLLLTFLKLLTPLDSYRSNRCCS